MCAHSDKLNNMDGKRGSSNLSWLFLARDRVSEHKYDVYELKPLRGKKWHLILISVSYEMYNTGRTRFIAKQKIASNL